MPKLITLPVVEPEQGNGQSKPACRLSMQKDIHAHSMLNPFTFQSPLPYYFAATTRCGLEQSSSTYLHIGASLYVGEDHKVNKLNDSITFNLQVFAVSWLTPKLSFLCQILMILSSDLFPWLSFTLAAGTSNLRI